mmetsp:Transcript_8741/g.10875  ORF Transcript_8741/g.10875 Transcript_8741/m.10875 type:complete len:266 (-) Transcript_8741:34-831(-)
MSANKTDTNDDNKLETQNIDDDKFEVLNETFTDSDDNNDNNNDDIHKLYDNFDDINLELKNNETNNDSDYEYFIDKDPELSIKYKNEGNILYKQKAYEKAIDKYTLAIINYYDKIDTMTDDQLNNLSIFYSNRALCYIKMSQYNDGINDTTKSLKYNSNNIKSLYRRAQCNESLNNYFDAKTDYELILKLDKNNKHAIDRLKIIEPIVKKEFDRQKDEVIDKLKGFANWGLGKIGLSLNNFEAKQDPNTGSYNIQYNPNPNKKPT